MNGVPQRLHRDGLLQDKSAGKEAQSAGRVIRHDDHRNRVRERGVVHEIKQVIPMIGLEPFEIDENEIGPALPYSIR
jgi:hypothetical protein